MRAFAKEMFGDDFAETLAAASNKRVKIFEFHSGTGVSPMRFIRRLPNLKQELTGETPVPLPNSSNFFMLRDQQKDAQPRQWFSIPFPKIGWHPPTQVGASAGQFLPNPPGEIAAIRCK